MRDQKKIFFGSRNMAQFGSGSRIMLSILKKTKNNFKRTIYFFKVIFFITIRNNGTFQSVESQNGGLCLEFYNFCLHFILNILVYIQILQVPEYGSINEYGSIDGSGSTTLVVLMLMVQNSLETRLSFLSQTCLLNHVMTLLYSPVEGSVRSSIQLTQCCRAVITQRNSVTRFCTLYFAILTHLSCHSYAEVFSHNA